MRVLKTLIVPSILLAAVLTFAQPASADPGATIKSITRNGCVVSVTVEFEDAGTYWLNVGDDSFTIYSEMFVSEGNDTHTFTWTIVSNFNTDIPGVGFFVNDLEGESATQGYDKEDPWDFPGSAEVTAACAAATRPPNWITTPATVTTVTTTPTTPTTGTTVGQNTTTTTATATTPSTTVVPGVNTPNTPNAPATRPAAARPATAARPVSGKPTFTG